VAVAEGVVSRVGGRLTATRSPRRVTAAEGREYDAKSAKIIAKQNSNGLLCVFASLRLCVFKIDVKSRAFPQVVGASGTGLDTQGE